MIQVWSRRVLGLVLALVAVSVTPRLLQAQTGKIAGVVTDKANGQPLEGVQVFLAGTGYGTLSNASGRYFLINVPPGTYTVSAKRVGYQQINITTVGVVIDVTREVDFALSSSATLAAINVVATPSPLFQPGQTGSGINLDAKDIEVLPVTSIEGALSLQQGFVQVPNSTDLISYNESRRSATNPISIRGGRGGETMLMIDDIPVNNFIFGGPAFSLSPMAVQQVDLQKGSMEPRYGNALSGVINIATKEGGSDLAGSLNFESSRVGDAMGNAADAVSNYSLVEGFVSGPVPSTKNKMTFMFSGREERAPDAVLKYDNSIFVPRFQESTEALPANGPNFRDVFPGFRAIGFDNDRQAFGKLAYKFTPDMKLGVTFLDNENERKPFDNQYLTTYGKVLQSPAATTQADSSVFIGNLTGYRLNPIDFERVTESSILANQRLVAVKFDHRINRTQYKIVAGQFKTKRLTCNYFQGTCLQDRFGDPNFTDDQYIGPLAGTCATNPTCGTDQDYGGEKLKTFVLRSDLESQVTDHHSVKAGLLYQKYDFNVNVVRNVGTNLVNVYREKYSNTPYDWASYVQDKIEYDFLTLKLGARFDYGAVPGKFFANPLDPTNGTTALDVCANPTDKRWANGVTYRDFTATGKDTSYTVTPVAAWGTGGCTPDDVKTAGKIAAFDDFKTARARKQFSPRMGVSFPLSQSSAVFFNFGRFSQNPLLNNLLTNTGIGTPQEGTTRGPVLEVPGEGGPGIIGNPSLQTERATTYEMGYNAEFSKDYGIGITLFNKNQTGLTGVRTGGVRRGKTGLEQVFDPAITYGADNTPSYSILVNQDFQSVRGFEMQVRRRVTNYWGFDINYSYSRARTNASDPEREFERQTQQGDPQNLTEGPSDIDRPSVFNASLITQVREEAPKFRFGWLLRNTTASATVRAASGYPYTPVLDFYGFGLSKVERNSGRGPATSQIDMLLQKSFDIANLRYSAFLQVANLLDRKNCVTVFSSTGTCDAGAIDQSRARQGNSIRPDITTSTYKDRADYFGPRRSVLGGLKVAF